MLTTVLKMRSVLTQKEGSIADAGKVSLEIPQKNVNVSFGTKLIVERSSNF